MSRMARSFCLAALAVLAGCSLDRSATGPVDPRVVRNVAAVRLDPAAALADLNGYRLGRSLGALRLDASLTAMAQRQANAMAAGDSISHDIAGSFSSRLLGAGIDTARAGENLGGGYYSSQEAIAAWRASSGHNVNLLQPEATRFGIAIAKDPATKFRVFWAMVVAADPERR